jgi:hypothetical protein
MRTMRRVVGVLRARSPEPRVLVAMLHNTELTPGSSPYSRTPPDAARVAARLREMLEWAGAQGMRFATLSEAAAQCASS